MAKKRIVRCVVQGCGKEATSSRRLCPSCYQAAYRAVRAKITTWAELEQQGYAGPDGRKNIGPRTVLGKILAGKS